eukprot:TRINITY_DN5891_c0_g1_i1.p2 TRINITY_DN5891_c0_g1~~TRINITY_DN5891_c0_g1_i1.p2  ORF type:complete len:116 (+),score=13.68 TRINITY_DN5891_c0_g1_i1:469-816(+)
MPLAAIASWRDAHSTAQVELSLTMSPANSVPICLYAVRSIRPNKLTIAGGSLKHWQAVYNSLRQPVDVLNMSVYDERSRDAFVDITHALAPSPGVDATIPAFLRYRQVLSASQFI